MSGIDAWWYVDRSGVWQRMPVPQVAPPTPLPAALKLSARQEQSLVDDGLADAVIDLLLTQYHPSMMTRTPPEQFALIHPLTQAAMQHGLSDPPQALAFVAKAFDEGPEFHTQAPWAHVLERMRAGQLNWQETLA